MNFILSS